MPYIQTKPQSFEYESELEFHDDTLYFVFSENLNDKTTENEWKQKVKHWFEWNSIAQQ